VRWLLDTNVLIHAVRGRPASVRTHLRSLSPDDVAVSAVTIAELWYGAARSPDPERKREAWTAVLEPFAILSFDRPAAERHSILRHRLRYHPIGERDLLIAAIALANDLTVVTHDGGEYARVPGLRVEDWV
jgi:tRNA(fMet)-specific endonuclease VapC